MRPGDPAGADFHAMRRLRESPAEQLVLGAGNIYISDGQIAIGTLVTSTVVVTVFDAAARRGGLCHFVRPNHFGDRPATALLGIPAIRRLLGEFARAGSSRESLVVGLYGGACPDWASDEQRELARKNVEVAVDFMAASKIPIAEMDVAGTRARKLWYFTATNELMLVKTDSVRRTDWFPALSEAAAR